MVAMRKHCGWSGCFHTKRLGTGCESEVTTKIKIMFKLPMVSINYSVPEKKCLKVKSVAPALMSILSTFKSYSKTLTTDR